MALDAYVKKHFWIVGAAVVVVCSALAATAVAHVIAATALADRADPIRRETPKRAPVPAQTPSASGAALVARNIFCSDCIPETPVAESTPTTSSSPPLTALPLRLVATHVSPVEGRSVATIRNTSSSQQGAYRVGESIPGAGQVARILGQYVDFRNQTSRQMERISLVTNQAPPPARPAPEPEKKPSADPKSTRDELLAAVDAGVRKLDDDSYEVDRAVVTQLLANPSAAARGARIVPAVKDGKPNGFRMYAVRRNSVYARVGCKSGDTIHSINGFQLDSMDKALEVYTKVRESTSLSVSLTRRGKPLTLDYTIK